MSLKNKKKYKYLEGQMSRIPSQLIGGLQVKVLSDNDGMENMSAWHITMPAHFQHACVYHAKAHEWFYVLEGKATVMIDGKSRNVRPGNFMYIAPGVTHFIRAHKQPVKVLVLFSPPMNTKKPDMHMVQKK